MKKMMVLLTTLLLVFGVAGYASALMSFDDKIDYWDGCDSAFLYEGQEFKYTHNINDTVDLSKYTVTSASLELDFTGLLDVDPVFWFFGWVDGREYVRYQLEDNGWVVIGEIDTEKDDNSVDDVQNFTVGIEWLNEDGLLDVCLEVFNPHGTGTIQLDHSYLSGTMQPVPEPATMLLLGTGLAGIAGASRKKFLKKK